MAEDVLTLDVFIHGAGVQRAAEVRREPDGIRYGDRFVPWRDVVWISRRSRMILVFAESVSLAVQATGNALGDLESWVDKGVDQTELRRRLMKQLGHEVVVFIAGSAVEGSLDGTAVRGLFLAVVTRRAVYLLSGTSQHSMAWPVDQVKRQISGPGKAGGDSVLLVRGNDEIRLRYLLPREIAALATACRKTPPASGSAAIRPLELFSRKEVSPPPQADLPEFSVAAGALQEVASRAAANVPGELQVRALMALRFFEGHFLELGEISLGPLLLRKSAASNAVSLRQAAAAMDAAGLQEDTRAAVAAAADRMMEVFGQETRRVAEIRGIDLGEREKRVPLVPEEMRDRLLGRMQAPFDRMWSRFEGLDSEGTLLIEVLDEFGEGSPGEDDGRVGEAAEQWRATLSRLDKGYVGAWRELVEEIEKTWSTDLLPRLAQMATEERRGVPEWVQLTVLGLLTLLLAVALVFVLVV